MRLRVLRIAILLWMAWYVWGPVDQVVDFWDTPRQQLCDMVRAAGGVVVLMAAGVAVARMQNRRLRDSFRLAARTLRGVIDCRPELVSMVPVPIQSHLGHAPPISLRI